MRNSAATQKLARKHRRAAGFGKFFARSLPEIGKIVVKNGDHKRFYGASN